MILIQYERDAEAVGSADLDSDFGLVSSVCVGGVRRAFTQGRRDTRCFTCVGTINGEFVPKRVVK